MARQRTLAEKAQILRELDGAKSRSEKSEIMKRHGITKHSVRNWRKGLKEGTLGTKPGRDADPKMAQAVGRMVQLPETLDEILGAEARGEAEGNYGESTDAVAEAAAESEATTDPERGSETDAGNNDGTEGDSANSVHIPSPEKLRQSILEKIVEDVWEGDLRWLGDTDTDWGENLVADIKARASKLKRKHREEAEESKGFFSSPVDYLGDAPTNTPQELCRRQDCPCNRFCGVPHIHSEEAGRAPDPAVVAIEHLRPVIFACINIQCPINKLCYSRLSGGPAHVLRYRGEPEQKPGPTKPIPEWTSRDDCPWSEICDIKHERPEDSIMELFNEIQGKWQPPDLWCIDPECETQHRRGMPHVHCKKCGAAFPAAFRNREINPSTMRRDTLTETDGLCDACYMKWKKNLMEGKGLT